LPNQADCAQSAAKPEGGNQLSAGTFPPSVTAIAAQGGG
jgi:hypothetical protein